MAQEPIKRVVVGLDGSEHSAAALAWAIRMARGMGTEVVAVFGLEIPMYFTAPYGVPVQFDPGWREEMKQEFEGTWCQPLRDAGVPFKAVMNEGRPASVIASVADEVDADMIVLGRRGRGGVAELILGSVSHELVLHASRPVLLIPPARGRG